MPVSRPFSLNMYRVLLALAAGTALLCTGIAASGLKAAGSNIGVGAGMPRKEGDVLSAGYVEYDGLSDAFTRVYTPPLAHKRNIFVRQGKVREKKSVPAAASKPDFGDPKNRFYVTRIYRKPVTLLFKGYIELPQGEYVAAVNWGGKTDFKKVGEEIRGYKLVDFKKMFSEKKTEWGGSERVDNSVIVLEKGKGEKITLPINRVTLKKEIYADIWDRKEAKRYEAYVGADVSGNKILDISAGQVIMKPQKGQKTVFGLGKKR